MARRGEGHVRQRESGSWVAVVPMPKDPETGARKARWITCKTEKEAWKALRKALSEKDEGRLPVPGRITLTEHVEEWLEKWAQWAWSGYTYQENARLAQRICDKLGRRRLSDLTPVHIQGYYSFLLSKGLLPSTVRHHHALLRQCLAAAVDWGRLAANPCAKVKPPPMRRGRRLILSADQMTALVAAAEGTRVYLPILLAVTTGMRRGEILALRWSDVDFEAGTLTVSRSLERTKKERRRFKAPKTPSGNRVIELPQVTLAALLRYKGAQAEYRLQLGPAYKDEGLIVTAAFGTPLAEATIQREYTALKKRLSLPPVTFHALRHGHASLLLSRGVPLPAVSARLGHSSPALTAATYTHVVPGVADPASAVMDSLLGGK